MHALQHGAEHPTASFFRDDPRPVLPGWIVSHMLRVPALEVRHPMIFIIEVKADDAPGSASRAIHVVGDRYTLGAYRSRYTEGLRAGPKPYCSYNPLASRVKSEKRRSPCKSG